MGLISKCSILGTKVPGILSFGVGRRDWEPSTGQCICDLFISLHACWTNFILFKAQEDIGGGQKREEPDGVEEDLYNEENAEQVSLHLLNDLHPFTSL